MKGLDGRQDGTFSPERNLMGRYSFRITALARPLSLPVSVRFVTTQPDSQRTENHKRKKMLILDPLY